MRGGRQGCWIVRAVAARRLNVNEVSRLASVRFHRAGGGSPEPPETTESSPADDAAQNVTSNQTLGAPRRRDRQPFRDHVRYRSTHSAHTHSLQETRAQESPKHAL